MDHGTETDADARYKSQWGSEWEGKRKAYFPLVFPSLRYIHTHSSRHNGTDGRNQIDGGGGDEGHHGRPRRRDKSEPGDQPIPIPPCEYILTQTPKMIFHGLGCVTHYVSVSISVDHYVAKTRYFVIYPPVASQNSSRSWRKFLREVSAYIKFYVTFLFCIRLKFGEKVTSWILNNSWIFALDICRDCTVSLTGDTSVTGEIGKFHRCFRWQPVKLLVYDLRHPHCRG